MPSISYKFTPSWKRDIKWVSVLFIYIDSLSHFLPGGKLQSVIFVMGPE